MDKSRYSKKYLKYYQSKAISLNYRIEYIRWLMRSLVWLYEQSILKLSGIPRNPKKSFEWEARKEVDTK